MKMLRQNLMLMYPRGFFLPMKANNGALTGDDINNQAKRAAEDAALSKETAASS